MLSVIACYADNSTLYDLLLVNREIKEHLDTEFFWKQKLEFTTGEKIPEYDISYKTLYKYHSNYEMVRISGVFLERRLRDFMESIQPNTLVKDKLPFDTCFEVFEHDDLEFFKFQMAELKKLYSSDSINCFLNLHFCLCKPNIYEYVCRDLANFKNNVNIDEWLYFSRINLLDMVNNPDPSTLGIVGGATGLTGPTGASVSVNAANAPPSNPLAAPFAWINTPVPDLKACVKHYHSRGPFSNSTHTCYCMQKNCQVHCLVVRYNNPKNPDFSRMKKIRGYLQSLTY